jgi:hypothetical protein
MQVNASGQFCGVAEMIGSVDFNKHMDFWQQDKWSGSFPVKWHIIKDVPNANFRHIVLENNDNKPVTNSRDTQEVYIICWKIIVYLKCLVIMLSIIVHPVRLVFILEYFRLSPKISFHYYIVIMIFLLIFLFIYD